MPVRSALPSIQGSELMGWFRVERQPGDSARDAALVLLLLARAGGRVSAGSNSFWAKVRLTKLVFDAELRMTASRLRGFGFFFGAFQHGPSSGELLALIDDLVEAGIVVARAGRIELTPAGSSIAKELLADARVWDHGGNRAVLSAIDDTLKELGSLSLQELLNRVYAAKIELPGSKPISVSEAKDHFAKTGRARALLGVLDDRYYRNTFHLPADWERTFLILGNPELNPLRSDGGPAIPV